MPAAAIEAIRTGATPSFTVADQVLVHRVVTELIDTKRLTDATFAEAIARFGEQGIVELGTIVGYYTAIGNALNAFVVPLPAGAPQPFPRNRNGPAAPVPLEARQPLTRRVHSTRASRSGSRVMRHSSSNTIVMRSAWV